MSGVFGLLSLFTNHPINFVQWVYYSINTVVLGLTGWSYIQIRRLTAETLANKSLNTDENLVTIKSLAIFFIVYFIDFFTGNVFMVYLLNLWFEEEYLSTTESLGNGATDGDATQQLVKRVSEVLSLQSATEGYEVFVSIVTTLITEICRVYFTAIVFNYYLLLRKRISRQCSGFGTAPVDMLDKFL